MEQYISLSVVADWLSMLPIYLRRFSQFTFHRKMCIFLKRVKNLFSIVYYYSVSAYLAMQSAVLAVIDSVCLSVCLSDCLSATVWYHVKMTQAMIMRFSLEDSHMLPQSSWLTSPQHFKGNTGSGDTE